MSVNRKKHILMALISLAIVGCNKDEEIINPDNSEITGLNYKVVEYTPAPGQFMNDPASGSNSIYSAEEACEYAEKRLAEGRFLSLGAWGGYVIVKFNNPVINSGGYDFSIGSNAFDTSNEPGIVWVMQDSNGNGKPDDTWFELKGSHFGEIGYERNVWVTYSRPQPKQDTPWINSNGETGVVKWLESYHSQDYYYPDWYSADEITFYGSLLPAQEVQNPVSGIWQNDPFTWGYADNMGEDFNTSLHRNMFKISDAVTSENVAADLQSIDFIKVQTAILNSSNLLGENSTEVTGFFVEN